MSMTVTKIVVHHAAMNGHCGLCATTGCCEGLFHDGCGFCSHRKSSRTQLREARDHEAWMHAACLSIAEGVPGWNDNFPDGSFSLAMQKVQQLRVKFEEMMATNEHLAAEIARLRGKNEALKRQVSRLRHGPSSEGDRAIQRLMDDSKSLGSLARSYAESDMMFDVHRVWPKIAPGGVKMDGFLVSVAQIDEGWIATRFGGGDYRVIAKEFVPDHGWIRRGTARVNIAGEPKRALKVTGYAEAR